MTCLIQTSHLTKHFEHLTAVADLNLEVDEGQVVALLGHNGAGKTTTVRLLSSMLRPSSGEARIGGFDVVRDAREVRRQVGVLTELPGLYDRMTAAEYIAFFGELYGMPPATVKARAADLFAQFELESLNRNLAEFSKGMRQKVALVRSMLHSPRVLFLDEPTAALDPQAARQVRDAILRLRRSGQTVLLSTHNLFEAELLADRIAIIRRGRLLAFGTPQELKTRVLGQPLYEIKLARPLEQPWPELPGLVRVESKDPKGMRYHTSDATAVNPLLIFRLQELDAEIVTVSQVPQTLEQVYLRLTGTP